MNTVKEICSKPHIKEVAELGLEPHLSAFKASSVTTTNTTPLC